MQRAQDQEMMSVAAHERAVEVSGPLAETAITAAAVVAAAKDGLEFRPRGDGKSWVLVRKERRLALKVNPSGKNSPELAEITALLHLQPNLDRYEVVVATGVPDPLKNPVEPADEFRITPRSTAQAYLYLANGVEVPDAHLASGVARPPGGLEEVQDLFRVHVCEERRRPACAFVAVRYRDHWFYIDDRDLETKATLMLLLQLRNLDFKRQQIGAIPALTLRSADNGSLHLLTLSSCLIIPRP